MRLGLDIGGTKIDAVALADDDDVLSRVRVATGSGPAAVLGNAEAAAIEAARAAGIDAAAFRSIGIGIPGIVDSAAGIVRHAVNLGVDELRLGPELTARLGPPVVVENDVNAAALGAYHLLGLDSSAAYLNVGTGLAAGFVINGQVWRGARGTAGEIGHIPIDPNGQQCACGQRGCLETVASGGWVASKWRSTAPMPVLHLFDAADAGDQRAIALRDEFVAGVAAAVRILVLTVDVDTVVIGGGVSNLGERLLGQIRDALRAQAESSPFLASLDLAGRVRLVPLDQPVAAIGAALTGAAIGTRPTGVPQI